MHIATQEPPCELPLTSVPDAVVLDTNVVLDWLLFRDPAVAALGRAVTTGRIRWLATASMRGELCTVLDRGLAAAHEADAENIVRQWDALVQLQLPAPPHALRCSDADDQKFFDLAVACSARWLVTRDRALLKLARRAAPLGLSIVTPARWCALPDAA
jgi:predicted nucleic acid-binding protein